MKSSNSCINSFKIIYINTFVICILISMVITLSTKLRTTSRSKSSFSNKISFRPSPLNQLSKNNVKSGFGSRTILNPAITNKKNIQVLTEKNLPNSKSGESTSSPIDANTIIDLNSQQHINTKGNSKIALKSIDTSNLKSSTSNFFINSGDDSGEINFNPRYPENSDPTVSNDPSPMVNNDKDGIPSNFQKPNPHKSDIEEQEEEKQINDKEYNNYKQARMEKEEIYEKWMESKKKAHLLDTNGKQIIKSGWLKISSRKFSNPLYFPKMTESCGKVLQLSLDSNNYLINEDNDDPELKRLKIHDSQHYFYFRLTKSYLYYTTSSTERHILGTSLIMSIISIDPTLKYSDDELCFKIVDIDEKYWVLCAIDEKEKLDWICKIYEITGKISTLCIKVESPKDEIEIVIERPTIIVPRPSRFCNENWTYSKQGEDWECECTEGKEQSPIDLPHESVTIPTIIRPVFSYVKVNHLADDTDEEFFMIKGKNLKIFYKNNMIKLFHSDFGRVVTQEKIIYKAQEIQFHTPSEHTIMGKRYDMEMQIIHNGIDEGIGKQLILSFLFKAEPGYKNLFFEDLNFFDLPNKNNPEKELNKNIFINRLFYTQENTDHVYDFKFFSFYTYEGSLTNPPCAENTILYVCADPIPISNLVISMFKEVLNPNLLKEGSSNEMIGLNLDTLSNNYRKTQNLFIREIYFYYCADNCYKEKHPDSQPEGHFEKIEVNAFQYFYVDSAKASGIPDSYVVTEKEALGIKKDSIIE